MSNVTRRSFVAMAGLGALGLVGCSEEAKVSKGIGESIWGDGDEAANENDVNDRSYVEFDGLSVTIPDGWSSSESDMGLSVSSNTGMLIINEKSEYDGSDEEELANAIAVGATQSDEMTLSGRVAKGVLNGSLCYSAPFEYVSDQMSYSGEVRIIFGDGVYWSVLYGDWDLNADTTAAMIADTISVL